MASFLSSKSARIDLRALAEEAGAKFNSNNSSPCPLHKGTKPNFHLYTGEDGRTLRYHCFSECPEDANDGNAIDFFMRWKNLEFKARYLVEGYLSGIHRSPFHGLSVEFSEYRQYSPGDSRSLTWFAFVGVIKSPGLTCAAEVNSTKPAAPRASIEPVVASRLSARLVGVAKVIARGGRGSQEGPVGEERHRSARLYRGSKLP